MTASGSSEPLLAKVRRTLATHQLLQPHSRVVVAVSGGADSVALLHLLLNLQPSLDLRLVVAHLDHALREDSGEDAQFVAGLAARWHLPAVIERREVSAICAREGWSLEDGARRVRYQVLCDAAKRHQATRIAVAHTADDQAETVLMRVIRGTGLMGLGGMPMMRPLEDEISLVRPLLEIWRTDLLTHLERNGLPFRTDPSNEDWRFLRNRIRHELLPRLARDYNPQIASALIQLAEQSRSDYAFLQAAAARQWKRMAKGRAPKAVALSLAAFRRQPKALQRQLVRHAIQRVRGDAGRLEFRHWLEAERLFSEEPVGTLLDLPGGVQLCREEERVVCRLAVSPSQPLPD